MGKKSDNAEVLKRVEEVLALRLEGKQFHEIVQFGSEKGWNVGDRQVRKYVARADALLVERQTERRKPVVARHLARRELLFARAFKDGDIRTALAVLQDDAKLRGLYPDNDLKELGKLATAQGARIAELEESLRDAHTGTTPPPQTGREPEATRPTPGASSGGT